MYWSQTEVKKGERERERKRPQLICDDSTRNTKEKLRNHNYKFCNKTNKKPHEKLSFLFRWQRTKANKKLRKREIRREGKRGRKVSFVPVSFLNFLHCPNVLGIEREKGGERERKLIKMIVESFITSSIWCLLFVSICCCVLIGVSLISSVEFMFCYP